MWHLKTRLGTFWVAKGNLHQQPFILGVDDSHLGFYQDADQAAKDVQAQVTGYFPWDCQSRVQAPSDLSQWIPGAPREWD